MLSTPVGYLLNAGIAEEHLIANRLPNSGRIKMAEFVDTSL